jgi:hypothetical protein
MISFDGGEVTPSLGSERPKHRLDEARLSPHAPFTFARRCLQSISWSRLQQITMDTALSLPLAIPLPSAISLLVSALAICLLLYSYDVYWFHRSHSSKIPGQIPPKVPALVPYLNNIVLFTLSFGKPDFGKAFKRLS